MILSYFIHFLRFSSIFYRKIANKKILIAYLWGVCGEFLKKRPLHYCNSRMDGVEICFSTGGEGRNITRAPKGYHVG